MHWTAHGRPCRSLTAEEIERIGTGVLHQLSGRLRDLRLEIIDGGVVLHGRTLTYHASQLAREAVARATGLPVARNEIEVS